MDRGARQGFGALYQVVANAYVSATGAVVGLMAVGEPAEIVWARMFVICRLEPAGAFRVVTGECVGRTGVEEHAVCVPRDLSAMARVRGQP